MRKLAFIMMSVAVVAMSSCSQEGTEGPEGPQGPAGPAGADGSNADFAINSLTVAMDDFAGGAYAEYSVNFLSEDIFENGIAMAYVEDGFGYWNTIPSQWHEITGFSYFYADGAGACGFDAVDGITADYNVRVITMTEASYEAMDDMGIVEKYEEVIEYLESK